MVFLLHDLQRQGTADTEEDEESPLPPERVDSHAKHKPVDEFGICKEVKCTARSFRLEEPRHVDPSLHTVFLRSRKGINKEHEQ